MALIDHPTPVTASELFIVLFDLLWYNILMSLISRYKDRQADRYWKKVQIEGSRAADLLIDRAKKGITGTFHYSAGFMPLTSDRQIDTYIEDVYREAQLYAMHTDRVEVTLDMEASILQTSEWYHAALGHSPLEAILVLNIPDEEDY